eukprot:3323694-Amphidinium_carterae.3
MLQARRSQHGSNFGFHGSPLPNWYSIMRCQARAAECDRLMLHTHHESCCPSSLLAPSRCLSTSNYSTQGAISQVCLEVTAHPREGQIVN